MAFNKVILEGRLCADPELRTSQSGTNVCRFRIAVDRQKKGEADYFSCAAFGKTAEFVYQWFKKGKPILVEGRIEINEYTDKDGNKRNTPDISIEKATFTMSDRSENQQPAAQPAQQSFDDDNDLPF